MSSEPRPLRKIRRRPLPYGVVIEETEEARERTFQRHPEWRPIWEERERQDAIIVQALREEARLDVESIADLVNTSESYPEAIPVLIKLLSQIEEPHMKEGIVRALTVKEARGVAARPLIEEFKKIEAQEWGTPEYHLKWAIANALSVVADQSVLDEILHLLRDKRHRWARGPLVEVLTRLKPPGVKELLLDLFEDEDIEIWVMRALGTLRVQEARARIEGFLRHPDSWVRQQAKRALAKLEKAR